MSMFNCRLCGRGIDSDFEDAVEDPKDCCEMVCAQCLPEEDQDASSVDLVAAYRTLRAERDTLWTALNDAFAALRYIEKYHRRAAAAAMASPQGETEMNKAMEVENEPAFSGDAPWEVRALRVIDGGESDEREGNDNAE